MAFSIGPNLRNLLISAAGDNKTFGGDSANVFPSIIWSLGGEIKNKNGEILKKIGPKYSLGWIKSSDISRFISIPDEEFIFIAFRPSGEDAERERGILEYADGEISMWQ
jgi:hypothetical protein